MTSAKKGRIFICIHGDWYPESSSLQTFQVVVMYRASRGILAPDVNRDGTEDVEGCARPIRRRQQDDLVLEGDSMIGSCGYENKKS
jgi:hypothetical protein